MAVHLLVCLLTELNAVCAPAGLAADYDMFLKPPPAIGTSDFTWPTPVLILANRNILLLSACKEEEDDSRLTSPKIA